MKLLLDTHTFIWLDVAQNQLSAAVQQEIKNPENTLYLSLASIWEMQLKTQLGKLHLNASLADTIMSQQQANAIQLLPIELNHILALGKLPYHHQDSFDRLLIAQSQVENLRFVTNDSKIQRYEILHLW